MRHHLNNPFIVVPLTALAIVWGAYSYGLIDLLSSKLSDKQGQILSEIELSYVPGKLDNFSVDTMRVLSRDSWLLTNWMSDSVAKNEPFIANYDFSDKIELFSEFIDDVGKAEEAVIIDQQTFEAAIATELGLDGYGFFVVFENVLNLPVRKRVGDTIYLLESGALQIPTFGIAESSRTAEEQLKAVESALSKMKLQGVGTQGSVLESGENNTKNIAFIQVEGATMEIYKQGELVHRNPSLGLDKIIKGESFDSVVLVDADQNEYALRTTDLEEL